MSSDIHAERARLLKIRAELGELKTEVKDFTLKEPLKVKVTSGSTAGANSGEFHLFRKASAQEKLRLQKMDAEWDEVRTCLNYSFIVFCTVMFTRMFTIFISIISILFSNYFSIVFNDFLVIVIIFFYLYPFCYVCYRKLNY
jgi:hypothetical protein